MSPSPLQQSLLARPVNQVVIETGTVCNPVLEQFHYLGPLRTARLWLAVFNKDEITQCQAWKWPTGRMLPSDGTLLELARWCITPSAEANAGSWFMARAVRLIRRTCPDVKRLISYSELGHHSGGLYRACNWDEWPTHHADRWRATDGEGYPSGHGSWDGLTVQTPKLRWKYDL